MADCLSTNGELATGERSKPAAFRICAGTGTAQAGSVDFTPTGKNDGKRLIDRLRKIARTAEPAVAKQIIAIGKDLATLSDVLRDDEAQLHELTCKLFNLTPTERALVDASLGR